MSILNIDIFNQYPNLSECLQFSSPPLSLFPVALPLPFSSLRWRQPPPPACYLFWCPPVHIRSSNSRRAHIPWETIRTMSWTAQRRALLTVVAALCLTVTYAVLAASGPSDNTAPPSP